MGFNACVVGVGFGADVTIVDIDPQRLDYVRDMVQGHMTTLMSSAANIEGAVASADLVVCSVLIPGARTPRLVTCDHLRQMEPGSALVEVAVDQAAAPRLAGRPHTGPALRRRGRDPLLPIEHARRRPHTSTYALTSATMTCALEIADRGWRVAAERAPALAGGVNVVDGQATHRAVAEAHGLDFTPVDATDGG